MKAALLSLCLASLPLTAAAQPAAAPDSATSATPVVIHVDAAQPRGPLKPVWAWFGYDEPNYTYTANGKKLLSDLKAAIPVPIYVRTHNLMTSGDGAHALKWGSTNMYTEDKDGKPVYDWTIADRIFDTYVERGMKPLAQIGFMPEALSVKPQPYRHHWQPGRPYEEILTGWAYPPKDYAKWSELIYQWVRHCVERYGQAEVESWYWELWNEPDGHYLIAADRQREFFKMYDHAADAVKRALPTARMGGPHTAGTGPFFENFLTHVLHETNYATGKKGAPLDFVGFHAKGSPKVVDGVVRMDMGIHLKRITDGFRKIAAHPELKNIPVILGESDPEGCAACGMKTNPENAYRNGTMYSSYTAASIARLQDIADETGVNLLGAVSWSFLFEDQPWFAGFRDLATNGVNKPVVNVFRMFGMMGPERIAVTGQRAHDAASIRTGGVRGAATDVNALASRGDRSVTVMVWNYHDDDVQGAGSPVELVVAGIPAATATVTQYRVDGQHGNSYAAWQRQGSPANPTPAQVAELDRASKLATLGAPRQVAAGKGRVTVDLQLPRQAVALVKIDY